MCKLHLCLFFFFFICSFEHIWNMLTELGNIHTYAYMYMHNERYIHILDDIHAHKQIYINMQTWKVPTETIEDENKKKKPVWWMCFLNNLLCNFFFRWNRHWQFLWWTILVATDQYIQVYIVIIDIGIPSTEFRVDLKIWEWNAFCMYIMYRWYILYICNIFHWSNL